MLYQIVFMKNQIETAKRIGACHSFFSQNYLIAIIFEIKKLLRNGDI
jgi:hypothetical protein